MSTRSSTRRFPDGSQMLVVTPDINRRHIAVNIRKFVLQAHSLDELVALGTLTPQAARFLEAAVVSGLNVLVAGGTQAGKITLLDFSPVSRPPPAARGGWPAARITGASTSWAGTSRPRPTPTTRSPRSSSRSPRPPAWPAARCSTWPSATSGHRGAAGHHRGRQRRAVPVVRFEAFIATHPELRHVRTRVKTLGQNGSRERGFGSLKYKKLFLEEIPDALNLVVHAEDYRIECNTVRPHEALAWNRPHEVHLGLADPLIPNLPETEDLPAA